MFASCSKAREQPTRRQIQRLADSITVIRMRELDEQSRRDLEHRMKIEVKIKVDSMLSVQQAEQVRKDSAAKPGTLPQNGNGIINKNESAKKP